MLISARLLRFLRFLMNVQTPIRMVSPTRRWTITVPKAKFDQLRNDPEFCAALALGRAVNALHFVHTPLLSEEDGTPKSTRDRFNSLLFTCALFAEAILLVEKIEKHFKNHPAFQKVTDAACGPEAKALRKQLFILRNTLVFHFDPEQVQKQMTDLDFENDPILVTGLGIEKVNTYQELIDVVALRAFFGSKFPTDLEKVRPDLRTVSKITVEFLVAAEDFMATLITERGWAQMNVLE
jgi:hypothetical protein